MADIKVSQLASASSHTGDDWFMVVQNGINKKSKLTTILGSLNSNANIGINTNQLSINTTVSSKNNSNLLFIDGTNDKIGIGTNSLSSHLLTVNGSISTNGIYVGSTETVPWAPGALAPSVISCLVQTTFVSVTTGPGDFSLSTGYDGQIKIITSLNANTAEVTCTGINSAFTKITLASIGASVTLVYKETSPTGWAVVGSNNATLT